MLGLFQTLQHVTLQALFYGPGAHIKIFPSDCTGLTVFTQKNPFEIKDGRGGGAGCR